MLLQDNAKRLAIFAYYDEDGIIDEYVPYMLRAVGRLCEKQIVVVNGSLTKEAEAMIRPYAAEIVYRANEGFDITAYKEGVLRERARWAEYDEVLFYNQTIFGPVCPLDEMFRAMNRRDVDFWGLTRHKGAPQAVWNDKVSIPPHVQSFFFAVRKKMLLSGDFAEYWDNLPEIRSYWDAVEKHEIRFTRHFAGLGYTWDTYIDTAALEQYNDYPLMGMPAALLEKQGCPFFKRKNFLTPREKYTTVPQGEAPQALYEYLRDKTDYPLGLVAQNLTRTAETAAVTRALTLCFDVDARKAVPNERFAAVIYIQKDAQARRLLEQTKRLAHDADCFVLFAGEALRETYAEMLDGPTRARMTVIDVPGPRYLFETLWASVRAYPYLLYLSNDLPLLLDQFEDATGMTEALEGIAQPRCAGILEENNTLGLLLPPMPSHHDAMTVGIQLPRRKEAVERLFAAADMRVSLGGEPGLGSRGGMFFARTNAVAGLARLDWSDEESLFGGDYPLWELLPPLAAQAAGALTGFATTARRAFIEWSNQNALLSQIMELWSTEKKQGAAGILFRMGLVLDYFNAHRYEMTLEQAADREKFGLKQRIWFCLQILLSKKTIDWITKRFIRHPVVESPGDPVD